MIGKITGQISWIGEKFALVETGGIGYKVHAGASTLAKLKIGKNASFFTHLAVREDALDLYGFLEKSELDFFEMLLSVSGIGPKSALGIIGTASAETLKNAIASGDTSYLTKVSGIGKKTAEKIIIELRDKLTKLGHKTEKESFRGELDALEALKSLGYSQSEAREALKEVSPKTTETSAKVKEALKILGGK
jgi:Holliday junction DNA helicase RuvA